MSAPFPILAKRILQFAVALGCVVPITAGMTGIILGPAMVGATEAENPGLDSHFRYLSGILLAIGLAYLTTIPHIERKGPRFRLLSALVVTGGLARLYSVCVAGLSGNAVVFALTMELLVVPFLALAQWWVEKKMPR